MLRVFFLLNLAVLQAAVSTGCEPADDTDLPVPESQAERESWGVRFDLREPDLRVAVQARYLANTGSTSRADSGVKVEFRGEQGRLLSRLVAERLSMDGDEWIGLGGKVEISTEDSLVVRSDTLTWDRSGQWIQIPGRFSMTSTAGEERGDHLRADLQMSRWSMDSVSSSWSSKAKHAGEPEYRVEFEAARAMGNRIDGKLVVDYDNLRASCDDLRITSSQARFDSEEEAVHFSGGVSGRDDVGANSTREHSVRRFQAAELFYDLNTRETRTTGAVQWHQDDWLLEAEQVQDDGSGRVYTADPARFQQEGKVITAGAMSYSKDGILKAHQGVRFEEGDRELRASALTYLQSEERLMAEEGTLSTPEIEGRLETDRLLYDLRRESILLSKTDGGDAPQLVRPRAEGDLILRADSMKIDLSSELLIAWGGFDLTAPTISLHADRGTFQESQARFDMTGNASMVREEGSGAGSTIQADSMSARLEEGAISAVEMHSGLSGSIVDSDERSSWIKAEKGTVFLVAERLELLRLSGAVEITHDDKAKNEVSLIRGERMELHFVDQACLQRIDVMGNGEFLSRLQPEEEGDQPSLNEVAGDELAVLMDNGSIGEVKVMKPRGSYYPADSDHRADLEQRVNAARTDSVDRYD